jgi:hypothetical protein
MYRERWVAGTVRMSSGATIAFPVRFPRVARWD